MIVRLSNGIGDRAVASFLCGPVLGWVASRPDHCASGMWHPQSEFMRRYREMSAMGGGMNFYGEMPAMYNITVNMDNPLVEKIMTGKPENKEELEAYASENDVLKQITDLALLANGMLKGKDLSDFIARSTKVVEDAYLK